MLLNLRRLTALNLSRSLTYEQEIGTFFHVKATVIYFERRQNLDQYPKCLIYKGKLKYHTA